MDKLESMFKKSSNGVSLLLNEIRRIQPDLPPECRDDSTFGALVVLHELSKERDNKLRKLQYGSVLTWLGMFLLALTILALHGNVAWLSELFRLIIGI